ncbi:MAG: HAD-IIB family hydrolase [Deltaproteobacteria bacterium]|nr:HAD-IIB family hydrolase [Deltaproteobacteria bacterium]
MRLMALASDYDGTLAEDGRVSQSTEASLIKLKEAGRKLILVSGRQLDDLTRAFEKIALFDLLVVENGALLHSPEKKTSRLLCQPPPPAFAAALRMAGVTPLSCGEAIVSTWHPHEHLVLETIRKMGLDLQVIFNKGAVMVLPAGVNKASGLAAALDELSLSFHNIVGIGDAENDIAFLKNCECSIAVANALPAVKAVVDIVTERDHGAGVEEAVRLMISNELEHAAQTSSRNQVPLGINPEGNDEIMFPMGGVDVLFAGSSGAGKSTIATGLVQRLAQKGYQFCLIDPEGDYESLENAVVLGTEQHIPGIDEAMGVLAQPAQNLVLNLLGVSLEDRPAFFTSLMMRLQEMRSSFGRPHWIIVDEAHHVMPAQRYLQPPALPPAPADMMIITVEPRQLDMRALRLIKLLVAVGESAIDTLQQFCDATKIALPEIKQTDSPGHDEALLWFVGSPPKRIKPLLGERESRRHRRKYASGEIGPDHSFYFRGPEEKLNLRAHNLQTFVQLAAGVDDATWIFHLRRGDYSRWFNNVIKDEELATEAKNLEQNGSASPQDSRELIRAAIEKRYTVGAQD